jgi:F0F1-type ATP synthase membrane subunit b/b'
MKKSILAIVASFFVAGAILTSCNTSAEKVENAQNNVKEANKDLDKANQEYLEDVENYRKETASKISANYQSIVDFNAKIEHETKKVKANYKKKITELEQKNTDMKKKMDDYKIEGKENWEKFKAEFSHDMDELGKAFKDLTVKNVK